MLAGLGRRDGHRVMEMVGHAQINGIHVRTLQQLTIVGVGVPNTEFAGERLARPLPARRNADDLGRVRSEAPQGGSVQPRNESGANHANTNDHEFTSSARLLYTMARVYRTGLTPRPPLHMWRGGVCHHAGQTPAPLWSPRSAGGRCIPSPGSSIRGRPGTTKPVSFSVCSVANWTSAGGGL